MRQGRAGKDGKKGPPRESRIHATIDQTASAFIRGWAFDPTSSDPVVIELRTTDGEVLRRAPANQPRADVGRELGTDGLHGFLLRLPFRPSTKGQVDVVACSKSGEIHLTTLELCETTDDESPATVAGRATMVIVRPDRLAEILGNETLVICGPGRGGTSLVAYILRKAGYFLGDQMGNNHEDHLVLGAIRDQVQMTGLIAERNRTNKRWGFKVPFAVHHIDWLAGALRNPVFLIVFRNPVATAKSLLRRDPNYGDATLRNLGSAIEHSLHNMELGGARALRTKAPSVLVDVDTARATPDQLVQDLLDLFLPNTADQVVKAIASDISAAGYKDG